MIFTPFREVCVGMSVGFFLFLLLENHIIFRANYFESTGETDTNKTQIIDAAYGNYVMIVLVDANVEEQRSQV